MFKIYFQVWQKQITAVQYKPPIQYSLYAKGTFPMMIPLALLNIEIINNLESVY
jgi:hypothetical protein